MDGANSSCTNPFTSVYDISVNAIGGGSVSMSEYRDKVLLIVNVASKCGLTSQYYNELVQIERQYSSSGLQILAFPCNQFGAQEPDSDQVVLSFVRSKGAEFPVFSKIMVNGNEASDLYKYLRLNSNLNGGEITWNFAKFLVNRDGSLIQYFGPKTCPLDVVPFFTPFL